MGNFQTMIVECEGDIQKLNARIQKLRDTLPNLSGKEIELTHRKIKIYDSMVDDLIYAQAQMKAYVS